jgi:hypothetical protein
LAVGKQHDREQHGRWKGRCTCLVVLVAGVEARQVDFAINQVVQGMLKAARQQLPFKIDGNETRTGVDVFVVGHASLRKPISSCDPCYSIWFTAECGYEKTFSTALLGFDISGNGEQDAYLW